MNGSMRRLCAGFCLAASTPLSGAVEPATDITIVAFVDADGSAGIDGQDLGDGPTSLVGRGEYEYGIRVSPDDVPKLRALLEARLTAETHQTASPAPSLVDLLEATFGVAQTPPPPSTQPCSVTASAASSGRTPESTPTTPGASPSPGERSCGCLRPLGQS